MVIAASKVFVCGVTGALTLGFQIAAGQTGPPTTAETQAILESLGIGSTTGPTTLRYWLSRDGGYVDTPPRLAGSDICVQERHHFVGTLSEGYSRSGPPGRSYWVPGLPNDCTLESPSGVPRQRTWVDPSISIAQVTQILSRTDEFLALVREFPLDEDSFGERFLTEFWVDPNYIASLERPSSSEVAVGDDILIANLPMGDDVGGIWVRFSIADGDFILHDIGEYSPPQTFAYQEEVRIR